MANTGFVHAVYGPDGPGGGKGVSRTGPQGLRVLLGEDGVLTVGSRDFTRDRLIRRLAL
ncbi:hypothetical protein [Streptomyces sp. JJ38]|uniref:hypothetical protein n=1 Tax=Streptomyces sp. JJ38 TaxID=2738128 RepID=UPI001C591637|nr:hypothetical protein [Streptomyces sp. JJ38]MBW1600118.1 hypothetical protein [Streptomyces sp. JJ38]